MIQTGMHAGSAPPQDLENDLVGHRVDNLLFSIIQALVQVLWCAAASGHTRAHIREHMSKFMLRPLHSTRWARPSDEEVTHVEMPCAWRVTVHKYVHMHTRTNACTKNCTYIKHSNVQGGNFHARTHTHTHSLTHTHTHTHLVGLCSIVNKASTRVYHPPPSDWF